MKKINKMTLSIGIPAHNEEANIAHLLDALLKQKQISFAVEKIYVVCDGCTDNTSAMVSKYVKKYKFIQLIDDKKRLGKSERLNTIYKLNRSDLLLTLDADVLPERDIEIELMVKEIKKNINTNVVGPRYIPVKPKTLMGWFSYISFVSFEEAYMQLNSGNNYYSLMGCASLIRKDFSKSFTYPKGTISDQNYLYAIATKNNKNGVRIVKSAHVLFKTVSTFKDWRISGIRSVVMDKQNIVDLMGNNVLELYTMPRPLFLRSLIKYFFRYPVFTFGAVLLNIYIRLFPLEELMPQNGIWQLTESNKELEANLL